MIDTIHFTTDKDWKVENVKGITVITFPEGMFEKVGSVQQFTFIEGTPIEEQLALENSVYELLRKLETFKEGV